MLIDEYLPDYQTGKSHELMVDAPVKEVYESISDMDMSNSRLIRVLFLLRGMPGSAFTLKGLQKAGFIMLGQNVNQELVLGIIGRFWALNGDLQRVEPAAFVSFNKHGYARAVWNFSMEEIQENKTKIKTETRIKCPDQKSYIKFRFYWFLIGPFSSWIRREILKIIKREAERRAKAGAV